MEFTNSRLHIHFVLMKLPPQKHWTSCQLPFIWLACVHDVPCGLSTRVINYSTTRGRPTTNFYHLTMPGSKSSVIKPIKQSRWNFKATPLPSDIHRYWPQAVRRWWFINQSDSLTKECVPCISSVLNIQVAGVLYFSLVRESVLITTDSTSPGHPGGMCHEESAVSSPHVTWMGIYYGNRRQHNWFNNYCEHAGALRGR